MSNPPEKNPRPKAKPRKSGKNSTPSSPDHTVADLLQGFAKILADAQAHHDRAIARERPLTRFHESVAAANGTDIRMYWDVRLVRGEDEAFTQVTGTSSMPGMLSDKLRGHATAQIQQEVLDKITGPLVAAFMEESERLNEGTMKRIAGMRVVDSDPPAGADKVGALPSPNSSETVGVLDMARKHERETGGNTDGNAGGDGRVE